MSPVVPAALFEFDRQRLLAGCQLKPEHFDEFQRLCLTLTHGSAFQFILAELHDERYRQHLIEQIDKLLAPKQIKTATLQLDDSLADIAALEARLVELAQQADVIHLVGGDLWFNAARWAEFNTRRDSLAQACQARLLCWLSPEQVRQCARLALDWWAWRSGVYAFAAAPEAMPVPDPHFAPAFSAQSQAERARRIAQLRAWLDDSPAPELLPPLLDELASLLQSLGQLDEALRIRSEKELPVYEESGDVRGIAVTQGKIADILRVRGQFDEALRIRSEEELPVYEALGDVRGIAITQSKIADILQSRGQFDEALRIYAGKALPTLAELGDVHSVIVTQEKIADILKVRGQFDEALRFYTEETLPAFEKLGDVRSAAGTQGKIADILQARGQFDEALRIRREKELPVYEELGDQRGAAIAQNKIADIMLSRGQLDESLHIYTEKTLPALAELGDMHSVAGTQGRIADILQARGKLDEALDVQLHKVLPVFAALGDVRERLVTQTKIAQLMHQRGKKQDRPQIRNLLRLALKDAEKLQISEAAKIRAIYREIFGASVRARI